ncbi:hypothetical protein CYPRO_0548 [Cyclonatronum proteinivorum]|uniref:Uncharacterized protein n=1 Tax=Cyclonatronum proteinivorum TaxID=1457365 RepID=A0A345UH81_9BACT|nr:hypothetical protein CYPRO_0548 [Cyclonatronum proteinivorum]
MARIKLKVVKRRSNFPLQLGSNRISTKKDQNVLIGFRMYIPPCAGTVQINFRTRIILLYDRLNFANDMWLGVHQTQIVGIDAE